MSPPTGKSLRDWILGVAVSLVGALGFVVYQDSKVQMAALESRSESRIKAVEVRLDMIGNRASALEVAVGKLETRLDSIDKAVARIDANVDAIAKALVTRMRR